MFVSYVLGVPFRPPVDSNGANKDLGDKFEREENSKSFMNDHKKSFKYVKHVTHCPYCKAYFSETDVIVYLNCSSNHIYHTNCLDSIL